MMPTNLRDKARPSANQDLVINGTGWVFSIEKRWEEAALDGRLDGSPLREAAFILNSNLSRE